MGKSDCIYVSAAWMFAEFTKDFTFNLKCPVFMLEPSSQNFFDGMKGSKTSKMSRATSANMQTIKAMQ